MSLLNAEKILLLTVPTVYNNHARTPTSSWPTTTATIAILGQVDRTNYQKFDCSSGGFSMRGCLILEYNYQMIDDRLYTVCIISIDSCVFTPQVIHIDNIVKLKYPFE